MSFEIALLAMQPCPTLRCRVCHAALAADAAECPGCGSRRPFACSACGKPVEAPLNPPQLLADGTVACIRHAPWATCAVCGREGIYVEASAGGWVYLGGSGIGAIRRRYRSLAGRLSRRRPSRRWLCPSCERTYCRAPNTRPGCAHLAWLACVAWAIWHLIR